MKFPRGAPLKVVIKKSTPPKFSLILRGPPSGGCTHLKTLVPGEVDLHKHPQQESQCNQNGEDEGVGKVVVHGQLDVVLPQTKCSTNSNKRCEDVGRS